MKFGIGYQTPFPKWTLTKEPRYTIGAVAGAVYGVVVLVCAIAFW